MEEQQNNSSSSLKVIIAILAILLVGSLVYIYKITNDAKTVQTELTKTVTEKELVLKDLQELKTTYDAAIAENTSMSEDLIKERDKVDNVKTEPNLLSSQHVQMTTATCREFPGCLDIDATSRDWKLQDFNLALSFQNKYPAL